MQSSNAMFDVLNVIEISATMQKHSTEQIYSVIAKVWKTIELVFLPSVAAL